MCVISRIRANAWAFMRLAPAPGDWHRRCYYNHRSRCGYWTQGGSPKPAGAVKPQPRTRWNRPDEAVKVLKQIKEFMLDESGLETVEWAIVGGLIVAVAAGFFVLIGGNASVGVANLQNATSKIK